MQHDSSQTLAPNKDSKVYQVEKDYIDHELLEKKVKKKKKKNNFMIEWKSWLKFEFKLIITWKFEIRGA